MGELPGERARLFGAVAHLSAVVRADREAGQVGRSCRVPGEHLTCPLQGTLQIQPNTLLARVQISGCKWDSSLAPLASSSTVGTDVFSRVRLWGTYLSDTAVISLDSQQRVSLAARGGFGVLPSAPGHPAHGFPPRSAPAPRPRVRQARTSARVELGGRRTRAPKDNRLPMRLRRSAGETPGGSEQPLFSPPGHNGANVCAESDREREIK
ncbi:hypothetical protein SKAU_G00159810 [Synaphobranchus kaupii]|uniref:Uncharacterized protein n=1 Tax=Synaphobranchus kaupii TaxID=118154 RepID=A0A9Q1FIE6_SYNKA|nr:hypothetical protein SKAU_G00159810 [Synaphobranchus kaupii]